MVYATAFKILEIRNCATAVALQFSELHLLDSSGSSLGCNEVDDPYTITNYPIGTVIENEDVSKICDGIVSTKWLTFELGNYN